MTKDEVQLEYNKLASTLGDVTFRACVPVINFLGILNRMLFLNQEMAKLVEAEKAQPPKPTE